MSDTIHETVVDSVTLPAGAGEYVIPVVRALKAREQEIADTLISQAETLNLDPVVVAGALADAGLEFNVARPEPEPEVGSPEGLAEILGGLVATTQGIVERLDRANIF